MFTLLLPAAPVGDGAADGEAEGGWDAAGCWLPCEVIRKVPSPARATTITAKSALCWPADRSIVPRYFLRLTGRSQKGIGASGGSAPPASRPFPGRAGAAHPVEPAEPLWPPGSRSPPDPPRDGLPRPPLRLGAD